MTGKDGTFNVHPASGIRSEDEFLHACWSLKWFAPRFFKVASKNFPEPIPFKLNSTQIELDDTINEVKRFSADRCIRAIVLKYRQGGCSEYFTKRSDWKAERQVNYNAMHFAHDSDTSELLLMMAKLAHYSLPQTIRISTIDEGMTSFRLRQPERFDRRNELTLIHDGDDTRLSRIIIKTAGTEKKSSGRGFGLNFVHFSEFGDHEAYDDGEILDGVMQGLAREHEVFAEGTPMGGSGIMFDMYHAAKTGKIDWVPIFLPWYISDEYLLPLEKGEKIEPEFEYEERLMRGLNTRNGYKVTPEQIKWMRYMIRTRFSSNVSGISALDRFKQEYPSNDVDCWLASATVWLAQDIIERGQMFAQQWKNQRPLNRYTMENDKFRVAQWGEWWLTELPQFDSVYVIGSDHAEGLQDGDFDAATILKRTPTGPDRYVGYYQGKDGDKFRQAKMLADVGHAFNTALLAPENKSQGVSICKYLGDMGYPNLYVQTFGEEGRFGSGIKQEFGLKTSGKSKTLALGDLFTGLRHWTDNPLDDDGLEMPFEEFWTQTRAFRNRSGSQTPSAGKKEHDDLIMAAAITAFVRHQVRIPITEEQKPAIRHRDVPWYEEWGDKSIQKVIRQMQRHAQAG